VSPFALGYLHSWIRDEPTSSGAEYLRGFRDGIEDRRICDGLCHRPKSTEIGDSSVTEERQIPGHRARKRKGA